MKRLKVSLTILVVVALAISVFYYFYSKPHIREFTLVAKEANWDFGNGVKLPVWTYNGTIPGPVLTVTEGDTVVVHFKNELPEPSTIHWHGIDVPNDMDGVPGVTQNAVQPGGEFTYTFKADKPGTYMYHSHEQSAKQVDKGLSGMLVVLEKHPQVKYDKDFSLLFDEWVKDMSVLDKMFTSNGSGMSGMDMSGMNMSGGMGHSHDMSLWSVFSVNGKSDDAIEMLHVKDGDKVRVRMANIGFFTDYVEVSGTDYKIVSINGNAVNAPTPIKDRYFTIGAGERYDIEFTADSKKNIYIQRLADMNIQKMERIFLQYDGIPLEKKTNKEPDTLLPIDITKYGKSTTAPFTGKETFNVNSMMVLDKDSSGQYTINGKAFIDRSDPILVKQGDLVKVTIVNNTSEDHPMHLHGHSFQVLSKNGQPITGSPLIMDTLLVRTNEKYVIAFKADNPGIWMFHCHELHHAASGMMQMVKYIGYKPNFIPEPNAKNMPD